MSGKNKPTGIERKREKDREALYYMLQIYCKGKRHGAMGRTLCPACGALWDYALRRIELCPNMDAKTFCSVCSTHCYNKDMRIKIQSVMRYSGPRMLCRRPIIALKHMYCTLKAKQKNSHSS